MTGRPTIILLTTLFVVSEVIFFILLSGDMNEFLEFFSKTFIVLMFILLFTRKFNWARWILSVLLIFLGLLYATEAIVDDTTPLLPIGLYYVFFGVYIHLSKALAIFRQRIQTIGTPLIAALSNTGNYTHNYPPLKKRYQALLADTVLIMTILIVAMTIMGDSEYRSSVMITLGAILLLGYEPILTVYSGTIGQKMMKLKVRQYNQPDKKIDLFNAYMRWLTKWLLGWISFVSINFNKEHRAIHDFVSNSVMIEDR